MADLEKLLAVKAFVLGLAVSHSPGRDAALSIVSTAIARLSPPEDVKETTRLVFYHLLRAEILRHNGSPIADRSAAQQLCANIASSTYRWFMRIEESTTSRFREAGHERRLSAYGAIAKSPEADVPMNLSSMQWCDFALRSVGEDPSILKEKDRRFLEQVTLRDILHKHGIC